MNLFRGSDLYDVAIVGCGTAGLTLAHLLAAKGVRVAAIDPSRLVCQHPRATHLDDETMRTLQTVGAADLEPGFTRSTGRTLMREDGTPFLVLEMPQVQTEQAWQSDYMFHQPDFESYLRGSLAAKNNVDLWLGFEVTALDQGDDEVELTVDDRHSTQTRTLRAKFVVGCDGAGSFVRRAIDPEIEDFHATHRSLIIDIYPFEHPETLPRTSAFVLCRSSLPVTYFPIYPPMLRFEFMLSETHQPYELEDPNSVYELLSPWLSPGTYRIMRTDTYQWRARLVKCWRKGRVFLAGDAAHTHPPFLGQGMCNGFRDVMNLAWKLALVVEGTSSEELLDTYESERIPHIIPYIKESSRQANMIEAFTKGVGLPPELGRPQHVQRLRPRLGPGLNADAKGAVGHLTPQPRDREGRRLDDMTGYNFAILGQQTTIAAVDDEIRSIWHRLGAVIVPQTGPAVDEWLAANGADVAIVRPDRYAFFVGQGPEELSHASRRLAEQTFTKEIVQ